MTLDEAAHAYRVAIDRQNEAFAKQESLRRQLAQSEQEYREAMDNAATARGALLVATGAAASNWCEVITGRLDTSKAYGWRAGTCCPDGPKGKEGLPGES